MSDSLFGTDGIRGKAGVYPLVDELITRLGQVLASRLLCDFPSSDVPNRVLIGHDGRASGESLAAAMASGLTKGGIDVDIIGLATTPCVAYLTYAGSYHGGVVISASHNPAADNGIKLLGHNGAKFINAIEQELENECLSERQFAEHPYQGKIARCKDLCTDYITWLRSEAFPQLNLDGKRILIDCANGAASEIAPRVMTAFGAETVLINAAPNGSNINKDCGATHPKICASATQQHQCDAGLSLDGDADRGILCDNNSRIIDGDTILAGLGKYMAAKKSLADDTVVATIMSNLALETYLAANKVTLVRTKVGDKYVAAAMRKARHNLGGEKSGHILFGDDHGFRGDGLYTLLRVMQSLQDTDGSLVDFAADYSDFPQILRNFKSSRRCPLEDLPELHAECLKIDAELAGRGRTVVRFSGTEMLLRLMVEADDIKLVEQSLQRLEEAARRDKILAE
ncbi:MAG: phosphoglucosamine mutase [Myxococcota bacterium]|jgi:phosphoglucosamine mutase